MIDVASMLQEIYRVLKPNGIYFAVSYGAPWSRLAHLKREHVDFAIEVQELKNYSEEGELSIHYLYVCRKGKMEKKDELWLQQYY